MAWSERQMPDLSRPRIDFDQMRLPGFRLPHEIQPVQPREAKPARHPLGGNGHLLALNDPQDRGVSGGCRLANHLEVQAGQKLPLQQAIALVASLPGTNS